MPDTNKTPRRIWTFESTLRVLNGVLNQFWTYLPPALRREVTGKRHNILEADLNDAQKSEKLWALLNDLVIEAGVIAIGRVNAAFHKWQDDGPKLKAWDHLYDPRVAPLAEKYHNLWAPSADEETVSIGRDGTLRRVMQETALALFKIADDPAIWAPYGRCAGSDCKGRDSLPVPIMPYNGKIDSLCPTCRQQARVASAPVDPAAELKASGLQGVTFTPAGTHGVKQRTTGQKEDEGKNPRKSSRTGRSAEQRRWEAAEAE